MNDLIYRQDAIDAMATWDWQEMYLPIHFKQLLEDLPSAQQWIPCSERLPKEKDMVLVTRRSGDVDYVSWSDWWYKQDRYPYLKPIAWMSLPEPYERRKEKYDKEKEKA